MGIIDAAFKHAEELAAQRNPISVEIAPTLDPDEPYEVRVTGPGGWRTAARGNLPTMQHEAWAWGIALAVKPTHSKGMP